MSLLEGGNWTFPLCRRTVEGSNEALELRKSSTRVTWIFLRFRFLCFQLVVSTAAAFISRATKMCLYHSLNWRLQNCAENITFHYLRKHKKGSKKSKWKLYKAPLVGWAHVSIFQLQSFDKHWRYRFNRRCFHYCRRRVAEESFSEGSKAPSSTTGTISSSKDISVNHTQA